MALLVMTGIAFFMTGFVAGVIVSIIADKR